MKKLFLTIFAFMCLFMPSVKSIDFASAEQPSQVYVINDTFLYENADLFSKKLTITVNEKQQNFTLKQNTVLDVVAVQENFFEVKIFNIYPNATEGQTAFVLDSFVLDSQIKSPEKILQGNAKVKNDASNVYKQANKNTIIMALNKNTDIRILDGYDEKKEFTHIQFTNSLGNLEYGYILTSNIEVSGVNYTLIFAVTAITSSVTIIIILLGINNRKKKKNKKGVN